MKKQTIFLFVTINFLLPVISFAQIVAGGGAHSLAVCTDNTPWGWGKNAFSTLGDGTTIDGLTPVQAIVLSNITGVSGGQFHSLFLKNDGTAWACGLNSQGRLGDGTTTTTSTPVQVSGLTGITSVSAGGSHSLFRRNDGTAWACGSNANGRLGDGTTTNSPIPVQVIVLTGISSVAAGAAHSIFLKSDGTVWACGLNSSGQLGDGTTTNNSTPVQVNGLTGITAVAGGNAHSIFLRNDGTVWACGLNTNGQIGDGTSGTNRLTPVQVSVLTGVSAISSAGGNASLYLKNDGTAWACGLNTSGHLGDGTTTHRSTPVQPIGMTGISAIGAGINHSLFVKNDFTVWGTGLNTGGQVGDGTTTSPVTTPVQVGGLCNVAPLPIELLFFTANPYHSNSVLCSWATASEINNDYFTLEKSKDAINFFPFANVDGAGNSNAPLYYQYIDEDPYPGLSYYRLKQTDFNGSFSYSDIRSVYFGGIDLISIYPNPSSDFIYYTVASEKEGEATLKLYDVVGREVLSKPEMIEKGIATKKLSVATLSSGSYLLRIISKGQEKVQKQFVVK